MQGLKRLPSFISNAAEEKHAVAALPVHPTPSQGQ
jgi:hypothetical protein